MTALLLRRLLVVPPVLLAASVLVFALPRMVGVDPARAVLRARTAEAVPGAIHLEIEGMGHNLPRALWPQIVEAIKSNTQRS